MTIDQPLRRAAISASFVARSGRNGAGVPGQRRRGPDTAAQHHVHPRIVSCLAGLLASIIAVAALTALVVMLRAAIPGSSASVLYLLVIVSAATLCGSKLAVLTTGLCAAVYDYFFTPPLYSFDLPDPQNAIALCIFVMTALVVQELTGRARRAARESARLYEAQSALLRVATRAGQANPPAPVLKTVCQELGLVCGADLAVVARYEQDDTATRVAAWSKVPDELAVGTRFELMSPSIAREVRRTGAPARMCSFANSTGAIASEARTLAIRSMIGCPIVVAGRLWGVFVAATKSKTPFPPGTESHIATFADIVAAAILTSAESRAELCASRARVVAAADEVRRRLGRDLHDGAQQRLVAIGLKLRLARDALPAELSTVRTELSRVEELGETIEELRELARGLHPSILCKAGLASALRTLAQRSAVPIKLHIHTDTRYPAPIELSAFYVVSEALTNTIKHANASRLEVVVEDSGSVLEVCIRDNGIGGANPRGSGLIGSRDRVEAIGGSMQIISPGGSGTTIHISLPIQQLDGEALAFSRRSGRQ
jgi:signal transduction histidine kinase